MIDPAILLDFGAQIKNFSKSDLVFEEGELARYYFQVAHGEIKMSNYNDEGKEFLQGMFTQGNSFGEPPLFIDEKYPANAEAIVDSELYILEKDAFFKMLEQRPQTAIEMSKRLAARLYYKAIMAAEIASQDPEHRLLKLFDYFKEHVDPVGKDKLYLVRFTRQQLADLTGLRVETVIRAVKSLEKKGMLQIRDRKIFR